MRRLLLALLGALAASVTTFAARADDTSPVPVFMPVPTALTLKPLFGEPTGPQVGPDPALAVLPLRLSMLGTAFPHAGTGPSDPFNCAPREDPSGNSQYGFPVEHQVYLAMTSQLVLHGFSRLGCPIDSVVGGGVTYTVPLSHDVSIVPSAGVLARSNVLHVPARGTVRVDLMMNTGNGRTLGIGVGKRGNRQGLQLTGTW